MADLDKRIPELNPISNPTPSAQLPIYDPSTDTTYRVALSIINPAVTDQPDQWDADITYALGDIVSYSQGPGQPFEIWVSTAGSNQGNIPGPSSSFWDTPADTPSVGFPAPWAAGIYTAAYIAVVHNNTIFWLDPAAGRPYNSTDIDAEITAGDWINLGATTSGTVTSVSSGNLSPLFTVAVNTPSTTPAFVFSLSNAGQNTVFAGPDSGGAGAPTYRSLVAADIPNLSGIYQPLDGDLTSIAALGFVSTSFLKKTAANTWSLDTTTYLPLSGGTLTGALTLNADPASALEAATKQYVDALVVGLWDDRGAFDASVNAYPSSGGSGTAGAILKGDIWTISVAGTLPTGQVVEPGDTVRALVNTPGNTQANWAISQNNIGYTPLSSTLNSGQIFVGNGSNVAAAVSMSGDISITNAGVTAYAGTVPVSKGGTNITSYAVGDILYASGATALSKLAAVAAGSVLGSAGATTAPAYIAVSNGLTATATTFKLGGALTADTNLSGAFSLGIGATPSAKLHVVGLGTTTGELVRFASNTPTTRFSILDNGQTTWVGAVSGAGAIGRSDAITVTATANGDTQTGWDYNFSNVDGGFTPLTRTIAQWRLNGSATPIFSIQPAQINSAGVNLLSLTFAGDMTVRNQSGALFLRGGSGTTTGIKFSAVFASSTNNNVSFNFTGTNHNITAGSGLTRAFTGILIDNAVVSASANNITYTGIDYNPDFSSLGGSTLTHYAMRVRSGLSAIGHSNAPTAAVDIAASITAAASLRIRSGSAPTSPNDGDIWYDGTDIKIRVGGTTKTFTIV